MKSLTLFLWVLSCTLFHTIQVEATNKKGDIPEYEIQCAGTGIEGTYLAEVTVYLPKPDKDTHSNLCKAAVHGVLFRGMAASEQCNGQRAILSDSTAEEEHKDFFKTFFATPTEYTRFVDIVTSSLRVTKIGGKRYRITATLSIKKDSLRKTLEQKNIIEGFEDLF